MKSDTGPFALIPEWVLDSGISPRALQLYAVLGRYADQEGECWPSRRTLWTRMRCAERSLDAAVKELEDIGALVRHHRPRTDGQPGYLTNRWTLIRAANPAPGGATSAGTPGAESAAKNESHLEREPSLAPASPARKRDLVFDALCQVTDTDPGQLTKPGRGSVNAAVKELKALGVGPDEIHRRASAYSRKFPTAVLTAPALVKHWAELGNGTGIVRTSWRDEAKELEESRAEMARLLEEEPL